MKNIQIVDGADNATFSIFQATDEEFRYIFPAEGQDIEVIEDFLARHHPDFSPKLLAGLWQRPIHKRDAKGIDGTLFYVDAEKRRHLPPSKREIDRDPSQISQPERDLYARLRAEAAAPDDSPIPATTFELLRDLAGGTDLLEWFDGQVPGFHDAEVLGLILDRNGSHCDLSVHTFRMTSEIDASGQFVFERHAVVTFHLAKISVLELEGFGEQNVIYGLSLVRMHNGGVRVELEPCNGLFGFVECAEVSITLKPGVPPGSIYQRAPGPS